MKLCFATNNQGKLKEIQALIGGAIQVRSLRDIGCLEELPENQDTLEGNSREKAEYVWHTYGIACFADDSGLEVDALQGAPGVYSAMYAGPECNAQKNMDLLLQRMQDKENRKAQFRTVITLQTRGGLHQFEGVVSGAIAVARKGTAGFGYDPLFIPQGQERTFAELEMEEKNKISHRGKAVALLAEFLLKQKYE